jgi:cytochrome c-type biogenesis protein CcmH
VTRVLRRWAPWVLLVLVLGGALVVGVHRSSHPTLEQRTLSIAGKVRCPVCEGQSAAQSSTPASLEIRQIINQDLRKGESQGQILHSLTQSYGTQILESPPTNGVTLWVWVLPVVVAAGAVIGLVLGFRHWRLVGSGATRRGRPGRGGGGPGSGGGGPAGGRRAAPADEDAVRAALEAADRPSHSSEPATPVDEPGTPVGPPATVAAERG